MNWLLLRDKFLESFLVLTRLGSFSKSCVFTYLKGSFILFDALRKLNIKSRQIK